VRIGQGGSAVSGAGEEVENRLAHRLVAVGLQHVAGAALDGRFVRPV
jgi:hypothetical protein